MRPRSPILAGSLFALMGCEALGLTPPKNLEECLLRAGDKGTYDAIGASERLCREVFSFRKTGRGLPVGNYFYVADPTCHGVTGGIDGAAVFDGDDLCGMGSRFERGATGDVTLACLNHQQSGASAVYDITLTNDGLQLSGDGGTIYSTLAACERERMRSRAQPTEPEPEPEPEPAPAAAAPAPAPAAAPAAAPAPRPAVTPAPRPAASSGSSVAKTCCACLTKNACLRGAGGDCGSRLTSGDWSKVKTSCLDDNCVDPCEGLE